MTYVVFALRLFVLFISFLGYSLIIKEKLKINTAFIPITVVGFVTIAVYFSGLLHILSLSCGFITFMGLGIFILYIRKLFNKEYYLNFLGNASIIFFVLLTCYFIVILKGTSYLHYDNFSHWGVIIKEMFYYNSLPDERTIITFRNYPPGTAVFIYYICKVIGYSESHAVIAQSIIISACFSTLFCKAKLKNISYCFWLTVISILSICILSYDDTTLNIYNLLVDALLGFLTMSSIIVVSYYKQDVKKLFITQLPLLCMIVLVKDSGKIFAGLIIAYIIFEIYKSLNAKKIFYLSMLIGIPLFVDILWKVYCKYAYPIVSYGSNKFSVSPKSISVAINNRTPDFIGQLPVKLIKEVFNINSVNTQLFIAVNVLSIITIIFLIVKRINIKNLLKNVILTNLMTAVYIFSLYILYSVVMNESEASSLSAFERYYSTIIIVLVSVQLWSILNNVFENYFGNKYVNNSIMSVFILLVVFIQKGNLHKICFRPDEKGFRRYNIQQVCNDARKYIGRGQKILVYNGSKGSKSYCSYVTSYEMLTNEREIINNEDELEEIHNQMLKYDYLLIAYEKDEFWEKIKSLNNMYADNKSGNVYKIYKSDLSLHLIKLSE